MKIHDFDVKKYLGFLFLIIFLLTQAPLSQAQEAPLKKYHSTQSSSENKSIDSPSQCSADMPLYQLKRCMEKENAIYEQEVKDNLKASIASFSTADLSSDAKKNAVIRLEGVQLAWEKYRKLDCEARNVFLDDSYSGTLEYLDCVRIHTRQRILDFDLFLKK